MSSSRRSSGSRPSSASASGTHAASDSSSASSAAAAVVAPAPASAAAADEGDDSPRARADAEREGKEMLEAVQAELRQGSGAEAGHADEDGGEEEDKVNINEHMNMAELTLEDRDEAASNPNSVSNSVTASPAIAPSAAHSSGGVAASPGSAAAAVASASALSSIPPVELADGGNASLPASDAHIGTKSGFFDVRVAVVGNVDSGKSTLIGVLTGGALDDGRGLARSKVFIHQHELGTGRTSAISSHLLGFDSEGKPVHQTVAASAASAAKTKSWAQVVHSSRSVMTFIDLAGHEKYLKCTIAGLTGSHPDYAIVIVNSLAGVTKMTREHLGVVLALEIPLICIVSKVDMAPIPVLEASKKQLFRILKSSAANKMPIQMRNLNDVETVISNSANSAKLCPVFFISAVNGTHIDLLTTYLSRLRPHHEWISHYAQHMTPGSAPSNGSTANPTACEFSIDEIFNVSGIGIVVSGTLNSGVLTPGMTLLLGPQSDNTFTAVLVRSLHYKRVNCASVEAGQSCAVSIRALKKKDTLKRNLLRRGQVLVDPAINPKATKFFDAEVLILHHPTTIKLGYQAVLHCGMIRQTAQICRISKDVLRTGDKSLCRFRFLLRDEFLHTGAPFVFREGSTKGIGKVVRIDFSQAELDEMEAEENARRKHGGGYNGLGKSQQPSAKNAAAAAAAGGEGGADVPASASASSAAPASSSCASAAAKKDSHAHGGSGHAHEHAHAADSSEKAKKWSKGEKNDYQKHKEGGDKGKK